MLQCTLQVPSSLLVGGQNAVDTMTCHTLHRHLGALRARGAGVSRGKYSCQMDLMRAKALGLGVAQRRPAPSAGAGREPIGHE